MPNPYHDETGKFCSRDGMLASIHSLASSGNVQGYLALKEEFDEIDKNNVVISKDSLSALLETANPEVKEQLETGAFGEPLPDGFPLKTLDISNLTPDVMVSMVKDFSYLANDGDESQRENIRTLVKESNYNEEVLWGVVDYRALPYDETVELINQHNPELYYNLAQKYPEDVFSKNKEDFIAALEAIKTKTPEPHVGSLDMFGYKKDSFAVVLAQNTNSADDLRIAESVNPYGIYAGRASQEIAYNSALPKDVAVKLLDNEYYHGVSGYWDARWHLGRNLQKRGIISLPDPNGLPKEPKPLGLPPRQETIDRLEALTNSKDSRKKQEHREEVATLQAEVDSYTPNFKLLEKELKVARKMSLRGRGVESIRNKYDLESRINNAYDRINQYNDLIATKQALEGLEF